MSRYVQKILCSAGIVVAMNAFAVDAHQHVNFYLPGVFVLDSSNHRVQRNLSCV